MDLAPWGSGYPPSLTTFSAARRPFCPWTTCRTPTTHLLGVPSRFCTARVVLPSEAGRMAGGGVTCQHYS